MSYFFSVVPYSLKKSLIAALFAGGACIADAVNSAASKTEIANFDALFLSTKYLAIKKPTIVSPIVNGAKIMARINQGIKL